MLSGIIASQRPVTVLAPGANLLLDLYPVGVFHAHSAARKLRTAYAGPCMRVRRGSDNVELDIGFDGSNNLDEAALLTFLGSGNGFVTRLYDQTSSPTGKDLIQVTQSYQPQIVASGVIQRIGAAPAMQFNGGRGLYSEGTPAAGGTEYTLVCAMRTTGSPLGVVYETGSTFRAPRPGILLDVNEFAVGQILVGSTGVSLDWTASSSPSTALPATQVVKISYLPNQTNQQLGFPVFNVNGVAVTKTRRGGTTVDSAAYGASVFNLGARNAGGSISLPYNGFIGEFIRYVGRTYEGDNTLDTNVASKFS